MNRVFTLLTALIVIVLQVTFVDLISIRGIQPDLVILFVVGRALAEGPTAGVVWGFCLGFALDAVSGAILGLGALVYSLGGFITGQLGRGREMNRGRYLAILAAGVAVEYLVLSYFCEPWKEIGCFRPLYQRTLPGIIYTWSLGLIWVLSPFSRFLSGRAHD